jgi:DNA replication protein DnaC
MKNNADLPPGFAAFWAAYPQTPRKADRMGCVAVWKREKLEPVAATVNACLTAWTRSHEWTKEHGRFVCAPIVWLRKKPWIEDFSNLEVAHDTPGRVTAPTGKYDHLDAGTVPIR